MLPIKNGRFPAWAPAKPRTLASAAMGQAVPEPLVLSILGSGLAAAGLVWASVLQRPREIQKEGKTIKTGSQTLHILFLVMGTVAGMKFLHDVGEAGL